MDNLDKIMLPYVALASIGDPYLEYMDRISETLNYKYYMEHIITAKSLNWNIDKSYITASQLRIIYSALLELFIEDGIPETFAKIYHDYLTFMFSEKVHPISKDGDLNTIFHYDAIHGSSRESAYRAIENEYNFNTRSTIGIESDLLDVSIFSLENLSGMSVESIINKNS